MLAARLALCNLEFMEALRSSRRGASIFLWFVPVKMAKRGFTGRVLQFSLHIKPICGILMEREKTERGFDITIGDKESV